jgi:hypothetical protein
VQLPRIPPAARSIPKNSGGQRSFYGRSGEVVISAAKQ